MSKFTKLGGFVAVACGVASAGAALAMDTCSGDYSAALLHPLPVPIVVALDIHDNSPDNVALGQSFMTGVRAAGQIVDGPPSAKISITYQVMGQGNGGPGYSGGGLDRGGGSSTGWTDWSSGGAASMRGGQTMALPDFPRYDALAPRQAVQSAMLVLRVEVHDAQSKELDWVASLQCTMQGTDNQLLAYQIGYLIGGAMGKRLERQPL